MELRESVARALRQLADHPRVTAVGAPQIAAGAVRVIVDFDTNLPNRWKARGHSDNGVKAVEPITFIFTKSYPADAPLICLRDDFDRSHPHIQPGPSSIPPVPCYVDGQTREFMRLQGIRGIADQLSRWLEKAAFGALIGEDDEWEPTRRDTCDASEMNAWGAWANLGMACLGRLAGTSRTEASGDSKPSLERAPREAGQSHFDAPTPFRHPPSALQGHFRKPFTSIWATAIGSPAFDDRIACPEMLPETRSRVLRAGSGVRPCTDPPRTPTSEQLRRIAERGFDASASGASSMEAASVKNLFSRDHTAETYRERAPILSRSILEGNDLTAIMRNDAPSLRLLTDQEREASLDAMLQAKPDGDVWIFGYGSLIWNPAIKFAERRVARIEGWHRSFCMSIVAGRASPATPGLMLALDEGGHCSGSAFRLADADVRSELTLLWRREMVCKGGYIPRWLELIGTNGECFGHAVAFTIDPEGGKYAGNMPMDAAVRRLATAYGGLGSCADYLFQTRDGLRTHGIPDASLEQLALKVEHALAM